MTNFEDPDYTGKAPLHREAKLRSVESMSHTRILPTINKSAIFDEAISVLLSSNVIKISPENIASLLSDKELKDKEKEESEEEEQEKPESEESEDEDKEEDSDKDDKEPDEDKEEEEPPEKKEPKQKTKPAPVMPTFEQMKKAIESILKSGNKTEDELTADLKEYFHRTD